MLSFPRPLLVGSLHSQKLSPRSRQRSLLSPLPRPASRTSSLWRHSSVALLVPLGPLIILAGLWPGPLVTVPPTLMASPPLPQATRQDLACLPPTVTLLPLTQPPLCSHD